MTNFDMTPLYRSTIGFDRLANIFDALGATDNSSAYPPYNVARTGETDYRISMAVAGFAEDELEIIERGGVLRVRGGATGDGGFVEDSLEALEGMLGEYCRPAPWVGVGGGIRAGG